MKSFIASGNEISSILDFSHMPNPMQKVVLFRRFEQEVLHIYRLKTLKHFFFDYETSDIRNCIDENGQNVETVYASFFSFGYFVFLSTFRYIKSSAYSRISEEIMQSSILFFLQLTLQQKQPR